MTRLLVHSIYIALIFASVCYGQPSRPRVAVIGAGVGGAAATSFLLELHDTAHVSV